MTQDEAIAILKTGVNVFLTGEPGSGKTHTVNRFVADLRECGVEPSITASTGIAATHIGGFTIHSWSGIGVRRKLTERDLDSIANNKRVYGRVNNARILIIDEVSMLSDRTLGMVDAVCREVRQNQHPFGGLQIIFVGDFFQLPPVSKQGGAESDNAQQSFVKRDVSERFAFTSPAWQEANPLVCYLTEQHRQEDARFLEFLSAVRTGITEERHKALLRTRYAKTAQDGLTQLYSHNADVDYINNKELARIPGQPRVFVMENRGPEALVQSLKRGCLSPETLSLKIGARVMFTKNDLEWRFVNGTTGVVTGFSKETGLPAAATAQVGAPIVKTADGNEIRAEPMEWSLQDGGRALARIIQTPLRLAWAITVHKSQGMSLDAAHMDLSDCFEYGQGYVALSRVRTLSGLTIAGLNPRALEVHPEIRAEDARFRAASDSAQQKFSELPPSELAKMHNDFLRAVGGKIGAGRKVHTRGEKVNTLSLTKDLALKKLSLPEIAKERGMTIGTVIEHLEKLVRAGTIKPEQDLSHIKPFVRDLEEVIAVFQKQYEETDEILLAPVHELLHGAYAYEELRVARLFLPRRK